jgi:hypothetical protein
MPIIEEKSIFLIFILNTYLFDAFGQHITFLSRERIATIDIWWYKSMYLPLEIPKH